MDTTSGHRMDNGHEQDHGDRSKTSRIREREDDTSEG